MNTSVPARRRGWPRVLALITASVVLLALAAATFTLSYTGIHVIALKAGVSPRLARVYPGLLDAALVIAGVAAVAPWVLLLLAFSLWLTVIRQSRRRSRVRHEAPEAEVFTVITRSPP